MLIYWKTLKKTSFMKKVYRHHFHKTDRKSTRLNSSHSQISYAVFCLKKKKKHTSEVNISSTTSPAPTLVSRTCRCSHINYSSDQVPRVLHYHARVSEWVLNVQRPCTYL